MTKTVSIVWLILTLRALARLWNIQLWTTGAGAQALRKFLSNTSQAGFPQWLQTLFYGDLVQWAEQWEGPAPTSYRRMIRKGRKLYALNYETRACFPQAFGKVRIDSDVVQKAISQTRDGQFINRSQEEYFPIFRQINLTDCEMFCSLQMERYSMLLTYV